MALVTIKRERRPTRHVLRCDCCGCLSRPADTEYLAARWAHMGHWDTPGPDCEDCGYDRCPRCVDLNLWPLQCEGWFGVWGAECACGQEGGASFVGNFAGEGDTPTIRLADGDEVTTLGVEEMPEGLIASG